MGGESPFLTSILERKSPAWTDDRDRIAENSITADLMMTSPSRVAVIWASLF